MSKSQDEELGKILYGFEQKSHIRRIDSLSERGLTAQLLKEKMEAKAAVLAWHNRTAKAEMLEIIGEDKEPLWNDDEYDDLWCLNCNQYQNADGDCWCEPKNRLKAELRQQVINRYGANKEDTL